MTREPILLKPVPKDYLWGGNRLNDDFGKGFDCHPLAETWECSTHSDGQSLVGSGQYEGHLLVELLKNHPDFLGTHALHITNGKPYLPILIKLIDAKNDLSIQVHPDDDYALRFENSMGKNEMWYILHAEQGAQLVYGFVRDVNKTEVREAIAKGRICNYLNYVHVHRNDLFFIEAGTVHALGAGLIVAEIQQNSNITYRLYDYNRIDKNGRHRELHIDKALDVANLRSSISPRQPIRVLRYSLGRGDEILCRCKYFQVERMLLNTELNRELAKFQTNSNSFHILLCIDGCGVMLGKNFMLNFFKGDCIFIPANSVPLKLHGKAVFLNVGC